MSTQQPDTLASSLSVRSRNKLLAALPDAEYQYLRPLLRTVPFHHKRVLHIQGQPILDVYFPGGGACSLTKTMQDGLTAEIATIGNEGVIGSGVFFGDDRSIGDTFVQSADGDGYAMPVRAFVVGMERKHAFCNLVTRYSQALSSQVMQTTVCNGLHSAKERCCRWLLMTRDRVMRDDLKLTQESLAYMLGVRRPTVTLILQVLRDAGLVEHTRGVIRIVNCQGLEQKSCECYASVKAIFQRLLPEMPTGEQG